MYRGYELERYKYISYNTNMNVTKDDYKQLTEAFGMFGYSESFIKSLQDMIKAGGSDDFIEEINLKHPSSYRQGIKKLI